MRDDLRKAFSAHGSPRTEAEACTGFLFPAFKDWVKRRLMPNYWRDGCFSAGPLLVPGKPLIFDGSCCWTVGFSRAQRTQGMPGAGFADLSPGPLSLPGAPG